LLAISCATGYKFDQATAFLEAAKNAPASGGGAGGASKAAAVEEEKPKEDEPEDVDMGGLFGDDEDDY